MENNKQVKIKKIDLDAFIEVLIDLYDRGVDYVDIIGVLDEEQDTVGISFCKEYMNNDMRTNFDKIPSTIKKDSEININLSDDDLNQLL